MAKAKKPAAKKAVAKKPKGKVPLLIFILMQGSI